MFYDRRIKMKKILFFIPNLAGGGAERVLVNLVNNMDSTKFNITVLVLFDIGSNKMYLNKNITYKYVFKKSFRANIYLFKLFSPEYLASKFIKEKYDIAISYLEGPTTRILSGIKDNDTVKINWIHSTSSKSEFIKTYRNFDEFIKTYTAYDSTVFVSETAQKSFIKNIGITNLNFEVKYNTVESKEILRRSHEIVENSLFRKDKLNLISVGRLIEVKGYVRLLDIVKRLVKENYKIHLYILGEGNLENQMKDYIHNHKLGKNVTLLGYKENPYKYVKQADLYVCSSYSEGFSTAVTESLIVGTPILTTRVSGMEEMLGKNNEYGMIVENDSKALYQGLVELITNETLLEKYKRQTRERASFFDTDKTVLEVEDLLLSFYE